MWQLMGLSVVSSALRKIIMKRVMSLLFVVVLLSIMVNPVSAVGPDTLRYILDEDDGLIDNSQIHNSF